MQMSITCSFHSAPSSFWTGSQGKNNLSAMLEESGPRLHFSHSRKFSKFYFYDSSTSSNSLDGERVNRRRYNLGLSAQRWESKGLCGPTQYDGIIRFFFYSSSSRRALISLYQSSQVCCVNGSIQTLTKSLPWYQHDDAHRDDTWQGLL